MKAIVDTTYLLPTFGIGVKELNDTALLELRRHVLQGNLQLYCLTTIWSELLGKVHREAAKHGIPDEAPKHQQNLLQRRRLRQNPTAKENPPNPHKNPRKRQSRP